MNTAVQDLWALLEAAGAERIARFDPTTLTDLPEPAQRFLTAAIAPGAPLADGVELEMTGRIKLGLWLPFTARQILRAGAGLVWAPIVGRRLIRFVGADTLGPDGAHMQFRLRDRITIVNASGPDIDRSAAGRLAAETAAWLPQALTPQAGATWQPINDRRATVTIPGPAGPADIDLTIDNSGRLADIDMKRWNDSTKPPSYQPFGGTINDSTTIDDITIAASGSVGWDHNTPAQADGVFFEYQIVQARFLYPTGPDPAPGKEASSTEAARSAVQPHTHE